jgi:two-component system phosphate regulon sensor histidine kinase PhoR
MFDRVRPFASSLVAAIAVGAWVGDVALGGVDWWVRLLAMTVLALAAGAAAFVLPYQAARQEAALRRGLELLASAAANDASHALEQEDFAGMDGQDPRRAILLRLRDGLKSLGERTVQLEQARARAEIRARRLEDEVRRVSDILTNLTDPVLAVDSYDEVVLANESANRLFRLDGGATEKRVLSQLAHCEALIDLVNDTRRHKSSVQRCAELQWSDEDGHQRTYQITCRALSLGGQDAKAGSGRGAVAVLQDITAQKAIQKRNAEFVSAVSHEMKTPLTSIKAYVELLADGDAEDEATRDEFLEVITSQTTRLQRLIDNLLNLARIEAGVVSVNKQSRSLNELLEEAAEVVRPSAEAKRINFQRDLSPMYLGVLADRDMLLQSAINLLSNAVKYTPEGGSVTLRSRLTDGQAVFEVSDTGVGLSPEDCEKVFEKFYRVKKDQNMAPGTGLGLPLAKHIVEDVHGGRLTVESELGKGSIFRAALPLVRELET